MDFYVFFLFIIFNCFGLLWPNSKATSEQSKRMNHVRPWRDTVGETKQSGCFAMSAKAKRTQKQINQSATVYTSVIARRELIATWLEYGVDYICHIILSNSFEVFVFFYRLVSLYYFSLKNFEYEKNSENFCRKLIWHRALAVLVDISNVNVSIVRGFE